MANLGESFNVNELPEDQGGFDPIPAGDYHLKVTDSSLEDTKAGTGQYIKVRCDVMGPSHQGRVLFTNINIRNPNPKAEEIGRQQLGSLLRAIGLASLTDTDQLIGGEFSGKVTVKNDPTYGPGNEIKGFKAIGGSPAPSVAQSAPAQNSAPAGGATPPWVKK
jgi:hypothetical protein